MLHVLKSEVWISQATQLFFSCVFSFLFLCFYFYLLVFLFYFLSQARTVEMALAKKKFEMARFDFVHHLNQLETLKKHQVVDR